MAQNDLPPSLFSLFSNNQLHFLLLHIMLVLKSVSDESQPLSHFCDVCFWNKVFQDKSHLEYPSLLPSSSINTHSSTFSFQFNSTHTSQVCATKWKAILQCMVRSAKLCETGFLLYCPSLFGLLQTTRSFSSNLVQYLKSRLVGYRTECSK